MSQDPLDIVRGVLQGYADRGVFRAFTELASRNGKTEFKFLWFPITQRPFRMVFVKASRQLTFKGLLRGMPANSEMYRQLRSFVDQVSSSNLVEHRRIDAARAIARCTNRLGTVSITIVVQRDEYEYGARKIVNLVHDLFLDLLQESAYYDYMAENFDMPEE